MRAIGFIFLKVIEDGYEENMHSHAGSTRMNDHLHCVACWSPMVSCICSVARPVTNRMPVVVYMHHKEWSRRSNSAHLLGLSLKNVQFHTHGAQNQPTAWPKPTEAERLCVLFPSEEATPLTKADAEELSQLIVLDGNWRQAKKAANRIKKLVNPIFRTIPYDRPSEFMLRTQSAEDRLSTYEAVARALSILENPSYLDPMMALFRAHVSVTLTERSRRGQPAKKHGN